MPFEIVDGYELDTVHYYLPTESKESSSRVIQVFFIPGNPGTLAFYEQFFMNLCEMVRELFVERYSVEIHSAGHLNHHLTSGSDSSDRNHREYENYDLQMQISLSTAFCEKYIKLCDATCDCFTILIGHRCSNLFT